MCTVPVLDLLNTLIEIFDEVNFDTFGNKKFHRKL